MTLDILETSDYPSIRALIDLSVTSTTLPDATIELAPFAPAAEAEIELRDPDWAAHLAGDEARMKRIAIYLTAARLIPSMASSGIKSETTPDGQSYTRETIDIETRVEELRALAFAELAAVIEPTDPGAAGMPTFFAAACGRRGR